MKKILFSVLFVILLAGSAHAGGYGSIAIGPGGMAFSGHGHNGSISVAIPFYGNDGYGHGRVYNRGHYSGGRHYYGSPAYNHNMRHAQRMRAYDHGYNRGYGRGYVRGYDNGYHRSRGGRGY